MSRQVPVQEANAESGEKVMYADVQLSVLLGRRYETYHAIGGY
jgi:hypothetical protein